MIYFKVSAPGRIVLSGEHSVMYGKCVILASLNRRTKLKFCELPDEPKNVIKIEFLDVGVSLCVSLEKVSNFFSNNISFNSASDHIRFYKLVQSLITLNGMWVTHEQRFSLEIFFFLLLYIAHHEQLDIKSFYVYVSTELPIGSGLGSSSSFAVCFSACFLHWARLQKGIRKKRFNENELFHISTYAKICEKVVQDQMFEIDDDVCVYGKVIQSRYINLEDKYRTTRIDAPRMNILLIDAGISLNKGERAKQMAELKYFYPDLVNHSLNRYDEISKDIFTTLIIINSVHGQSDFLQKEAYIALQLYIQMNQLVLFKLNMTHPSLELIRSVALQHELAGKLAGFGGGFVYIPLPPHIPKKQITNFSKLLKTQGFNITMTSVNCNGVTID